MQALPGRSQSFGKRREVACGKEKCDKQMLRRLRKQGPSQGGDCQRPPGGRRSGRGTHIHQDFAARLAEEGKYGVEDALLVLGDGARCRVLVRGAVASAVGHLEKNKQTKKHGMFFFFFVQVGLNVRSLAAETVYGFAVGKKRRAKHFCHFNWLGPTIVASPLELTGNSGAPPRQISHME